MDPELEALLAQLTPEQLQQYMGLGTVDERSDLVAQQLAQADALRGQAMGDYSTPGGAALGGIGNIVEKMVGGYQGQELRGQQQDLLGQKDAGRMMFLEALRGKKPGLPADAGALDLSALGMMGGGLVS